MKLNYNFYNQHVVDVAKNLLGKRLFCGTFFGIIAETEAYRGSEDEASHASKGVTPRSSVMFGLSGRAYVYMIYGMYYCFNIVCEPLGQPAAVLIRGLRMTDIFLDGPGKICRYLSINKKYNAYDIVKSNYLYLKNGFLVDEKDYIATSRYGIKKSLDKKWRFVLNKNFFSNKIYDFID